MNQRSNILFPSLHLNLTEKDRQLNDIDVVYLKYLSIISLYTIDFLTETIKLI